MAEERVNFTLRLPWDLRQAVKLKARSEGLTVNEWITLVLKQKIEDAK